MNDWRMDAYYYGFDRTGVEAIDRILSAVACAGKSYHHTECWNDDAAAYPHLRGETPVKCIQNAAIDAAALAAWQPIETAPKDGTMLILWVEAIDKEDSCHPTENAMAWRTIGHNNFDHDGRDVWEFAGWCWQHDHWVQGDGTPTMWMPIPAAPQAQVAVTAGERDV